jgi:polyisoprenyl-teichoic acid--peptidoglycan teichoic acid transferase
MPNASDMRNFDAINAPHFNTPTNNIAPRRPRKRRRWILLVVVLALITAIGFSANTLLSKTNKIFTNKENIFTRVGRLIAGDDKPLKGEETGTVNILLLGMGGPGHDGPLLTDTMIVASIDINTSEVMLTSIPRDFLVTLKGRGFNKINAAYAYAEQDEEGSGGEAAIEVAEKVTGLDIPYYAAVDFKGFVKAVDRVGGLDITVDRTFTDSSYPNYNKGYLPPQTFTKGDTHMDGERALIFARSRKGNNGEGSDFARSERQKKVMLAMKDELSQLNLSDLGTLNGLLSDFTENFRTNFEPFELKRLADLGKKINHDNVLSISLEPQGDLICDGLIDLGTGRPAQRTPPPPPPPAPIKGETPTEQTPVQETAQPVGAYVVTTCEGKTLEDIHVFLETADVVARLTQENATIEVQNSTGKAYVLEPWRALARQGVNIKITAFKGKTAYERTILYDNSKGAKPRALQYLKNNYTFTVSDVPFYDGQAGSDIVIILGKDAL